MHGILSRLRYRHLRVAVAFNHQTYWWLKAMKTIQEAKKHLQNLIDECEVSIKQKKDRLGSWSDAEMKSASELLSAIANGERRAQDMTKRQWKLVSLDQESDRLIRYQQVMAQSDQFVVGMQNMPPDAFRRKWVSPAGFDPQDHAVFLEA